jgi:hypothetical protein
LSCQHLEISEFGTYTVDMGGKTQVMTLQKCGHCGRYLRLDGSEIGEERILGHGGATKAKMRTVTLHLTSDVYERLERVLAKELGKEDPSRLMSEIVALGLKDYEKIVKVL